jgi:hypothetical protein
MKVPSSQLGKSPLRYLGLAMEIITPTNDTAVIFPYCAGVGQAENNLLKTPAGLLKHPKRVPAPTLEISIHSDCTATLGSGIAILK